MCARKGRPPGDRMTRVPRARLPDEPSLPYFHSSRDPALGVGSERTRLDGAGRGSRASCGPFEGGVKRWQLQDNESSQLLFGVSIWTILYASLSVLNFYSSSCFRYFQRIACNVDA